MYFEIQFIDFFRLHCHSTTNNIALRSRGHMNILYLNYEFPPIGGGGSPVSYEIAKGYVKHGHNVDVVTMKYRGLPDFEIREGIAIYRVPCLRSKKEICHPWEQLSYLLSARRFLGKRLKEVRYDICHAHFIIPTGPLARWVKKKFGIPYILTSHGSDVLGYNERFAKLYPLLKGPWMRVLGDALWVTAPSDFLRGEIRGLYDDKKVITVSNGLDMTKFIAMKKEKRILLVARLFVNKGVHDVLEALKGLDLGKWHVDIVGDGPHRSALEEFARGAGLSDRVTFHGWVDNSSPRIRELYGKASVFISASYFESFGQTALEAISAGCYPILSDIGGYRSIVRKDSHFFPPGDSGRLREMLKKILVKGIPVASIDIRRFSWDEVIKQFLRLLTERP